MVFRRPSCGYHHLEISYFILNNKFLSLDIVYYSLTQKLLKLLVMCKAGDSKVENKVSIYPPTLYLDSTKFRRYAGKIAKWNY